MLCRDIKEAARCEHLHISRSGKYLDAPVRLEFACSNPEVAKEYPHARFGSLDICRVCEHWAVKEP